MAVTMTRAEYQAKYGVAPVFSTSTIDTKPAPIRMTRAEYEAQYGTKSDTPITDALVPRSTYNPLDTGLSNIPKAVGNIPSEVARAVESTARVPGAVASTVTDPSVRSNPLLAAKEFYKAEYDMAVKPVVDTLSTIGNTFLGGIQQLIKTTTGYEIGDKKAKEALDNIDPNLYKAAQTIQEMLVNNPLATAAAGAKPAEAVSKPIRNAVQVAGERRAVANTVETTNAIADEIANIENNYSKLRTANEYAKDSGAASRQRIAQTDVLVDAVDPEGTIRTTQKGGAVDQYRAQTIDGKEGVVRTNLVNEGKKINLNQVERALKAEVGTSGLEGADLIQALNGIKKEIAGLRLRADEFGNIDLFKIHDAKIATTRNINFQTPPETATYRKATARTYKQLVEDNSTTNVKEVNAELKKFYDDIARLENLDGRKVKGGKLGKYFAQISGNLIGGAAGGAVGGPIGMAIGTVVGGETAGFIKGKQLSSSFGEARGLAPKPNAVLDKAAQTAKEGPKVDLKTPDKKVGAPKSVEKTKEILKIEKQISDNVDAQKKAISKGDYTLVATLKDVYGSLVEKLKDTIKNKKTDQPVKKLVSAKQPQARPKEPVINEAQNRRQEIQLAKEALAQMPGKAFMKYVSKTTGQLPEVTGETKMQSLTGNGKIVDRSEFGTRGDQIIQEILGAGDNYKQAPTPEYAQKLVDDYIKERDRIQKLEEQLKASDIPF